MESPSENCSHFPIVTLGFSSPLTDLSSFFKWYLFRLFPQEVSYRSCSSVGNAFLACSILGVTATWGISPASDDEHNFCKYLEVSKSYIWSTGRRVLSSIRSLSMQCRCQDAKFSCVSLSLKVSNFAQKCYVTMKGEGFLIWLRNEFWR